MVGQLLDPSADHRQVLAAGRLAGVLLGGFDAGWGPGAPGVAALR
ncbi:MAG: hypothetical protein ACXVXL_31435 [Solirubrobacteraceae bacterium]